MDIVQFRKMFEPHFEKYVQECMENMHIRLKDPLLKKLMNQAGKIALAGGKRARPFLVYSMYKMSGGKDDKVALRIAMSVEMFHIFCLIHDDITDRGKVRHGQKTIHECAKHAMHNAHQEALKVFIDALQDVIAGQMIDVDLTTRSKTTSALILKKMQLKTASYTFIRPLELGAALAGASHEVRKFCRVFGLEMGVAFQLQDDLLDIIGTQKTIGKKPLGDIREGQHTPISQYAFAHAAPQDREELMRVFGNLNLSPADAVRVQAIFKTSGALQYAERKITRGFIRARYMLNNAPLEKEGKAILLQLLTYIQKRTA